MGQCLVTKLRESVADSSLLKLGEKTVKLKVNGKLTLRGNNMIVRTVGGGTFNTTSTASDVPAQNAISEYRIVGGYVEFTNNEDYDIILGIKNLTEMTAFSAESNTENYLEVDLSLFSTYPYDMDEIKIWGQTIVGGTLSDILNVNKSGRVLSICFRNSIGVVGNYEELGVLNLGSMPIVTNCKNVTGDIVNFVKKQRARGKTQASYGETDWCTGSGLTFNGEAVPEFDWTTISWTANTITFNGKTINV